MTYAVQNNDINSLRDFVASDPKALEKLTENPREILAGFGLEIDEATSAALTQNLEVREALDVTAQAAVVHIDL